jgi:hypothetical protein
MRHHHVSACSSRRTRRKSVLCNRRLSLQRWQNSHRAASSS